MQISELYLRKIQELYDLTDSVMVSYRGNKEQLEKHLDGYDWSDINAAINRYYNRRSTITPPKVQQIIAIADDNGAKKYGVEEGSGIVYRIPKTNLNVIRETFDKMVRVMIDCGVLMDERGEFNMVYSLMDSKTGLPMMNPRQMLGWMVDDVEKENPELFEKFNSLTFWERLAICLMNKKISIKVRNWSAYSESRNVM